MTAKEKLALAVHSLDKHLAKEIVAIDVQGISAITDFFVFATGSSTTQTKALCDYVEKDMAGQGFVPQRIEGYAASRWILMDYSDVVIHIFLKEAREFYDLERLWQDGKTVDITEFLETEGI